MMAFRIIPFLGQCVARAFPLPSWERARVRERYKFKSPSPQSSPVKGEDVHALRATCSLVFCIRQMVRARCHKPYAIRHVLFPVLVVLTACTIPQAIVRATRPVGDGTFVLFLDGPAKTPFSMTLDLAALQAARADGI